MRSKAIWLALVLLLPATVYGQADRRVAPGSALAVSSEQARAVSFSAKEDSLQWQVEVRDLCVVSLKSMEFETPCSPWRPLLEKGAERDLLVKGDVQLPFGETTKVVFAKKGKAAGGQRYLLTAKLKEPKTGEKAKRGPLEPRGSGLWALPAVALGKVAIMRGGAGGDSQWLLSLKVGVGDTPILWESSSAIQTLSNTNKTLYQQVAAGQVAAVSDHWQCLALDDWQGKGELAARPAWKGGAKASQELLFAALELSSQTCPEIHARAQASVCSDGASVAPTLSGWSEDPVASHALASVFTERCGAEAGAPVFAAARGLFDELLGQPEHRLGDAISFRTTWHELLGSEFVDSSRERLGVAASAQLRALADAGDLAEMNLFIARYGKQLGAEWLTTAQAMRIERIEALFAAAVASMDVGQMTRVLDEHRQAAGEEWAASAETRRIDHVNGLIDAALAESDLGAVSALLDEHRAVLGEEWLASAAQKRSGVIEGLFAAALASKDVATLSRLLDEHRARMTGQWLDDAEVKRAELARGLFDAAMKAKDAGKATAILQEHGPVLGSEWLAEARQSRTSLVNAQIDAALAKHSLAKVTELIDQHGAALGSQWQVKRKVARSQMIDAHLGDLLIAEKLKKAKAWIVASQQVMDPDWEFKANERVARIASGDPHDKVIVSIEAIKTARKALYGEWTRYRQEAAKLEQSGEKFAAKGSFESTGDWIKRRAEGQKVLNKLREKLIPFRKALIRVAAIRYKTPNIKLEALPENYDADRGTWSMAFQHLDFGKKRQSFVKTISKDKAEKLSQDLERVKKSGVLAIGADDLPHLVSVSLKGPRGTDFKHSEAYRHLSRIAVGSGQVVGLSFLPGRPHLVVGTQGDGALVTRAAQGNFAAVRSEKYAGLKEVNVSGAGNYLVVRSSNQDHATVALEVAEGGGYAAEWRLPATSHAAVSPSGRIAAVAATNSVHVHVLPEGGGSVTEAPLYRLACFGKIGGLAFHPDGRLLTVGCGSEEVKLKTYDLHDGKLAREVSLTPDWMVSFGSDWTGLRNWLKQQYRSYMVGITGLAYSPGAKHLAVSNGRYVLLLDPTRGTKKGKAIVRRMLPGSSSLAFSRDGRYLAARSGQDAARNGTDHNVWLYDVSSTKSESGCRVEQVKPDSTARQIGLRRGGVITRINFRHEYRNKKVVSGRAGVPNCHVFLDQLEAMKRASGQWNGKKPWSISFKYDGQGSKSSSFDPPGSVPFGLRLEYSHLNSWKLSNPSEVALSDDLQVLAVGQSGSVQFVWTDIAVEVK